MNQEQLEKIGVASFRDLLPPIPKELILPDLNLPHGKNELELTEYAAELARLNRPTVSFLGAGAYEHFIPGAVWELVKRGEFLTAYTPYQPEASQGILLALFEFQTMISELTAMDAANASMYEGATALAEAVLLARRWFLTELSLTPKKILIPKTLHPHYKSTLRTYLHNLDTEIGEIPYDRTTGKLALRVLEKALEDPGVYAFAVCQPNFFGVIEETDLIGELRRKTQALFISVVNNPLSLGILTPPGDYNADIAVSDGQALGLPPAYGGPYSGLFAVKKEYIRKLPGRICGRTKDAEGKIGYALTLQTREQHIRREKATSNICTNQTLCAIANAVFLSLLGPSGLKEAAELSFSKAHELWERLTWPDSGAGRPLFQHEEFFQEFIFEPKVPLERLEAAAEQAGILPGYPIGKDFPELDKALLIAATEKTQMPDMARLASLLAGNPQVVNRSAWGSLSPPPGGEAVRWAHGTWGAGGAAPKAG